MADREKVIKGLEVCRDQNNPPGYRFTSCSDDCPYHENGCARKLKEDAIELLKEQEAVEPYEAEMMITHDDGSVEYLKDIDSVMLLAHMDYQITYTGEF